MKTFYITAILHGNMSLMCKVIAETFDDAHDMFVKNYILRHGYGQHLDDFVICVADDATLDIVS